MAPVAMLVGFCAVMAMIAIVRLVIDDDRDLVDVGTTSIVVAITALASWWVALEEVANAHRTNGVARGRNRFRRDRCRARRPILEPDGRHGEHRQNSSAGHGECG